MVFTVILQCDTHPGTRLCYDKNEIQKRKKSITFFFGILEVDVLLTSHRHRSLGKENHFKNDATWVRGSAAASKPTVSLVAKTTGVPVQSPLQGNQQHTHTHTRIRVCATSVTSIKIYSSHGVHAGVCSWGTFRRTFPKPQTFANIKNKCVKPFVWSSTQWTPATGTSTTINQQMRSL